MTVNNFQYIEKFLQPTNENDFWFAQIIKRKKDNPDMNRSERIIKSYNIKDYEHLIYFQEEIQSLCDYNNARFYLNLNVRDLKLCHIRLIQALMTNIAQDTYSAIYSKVDSVLGSTMTPGRTKYWIADIDEKDYDLVNELKDAIDNCNGKESTVFETLNGFHIICEPFNRKEIVFKEIKINSPTLIYFNKNENN